MATDLSLDPDLLERAVEVSGNHTKKAAATLALGEVIWRRKQKRLLDLMANLERRASIERTSELHLHPCR